MNDSGGGLWQPSEDGLKHEKPGSWETGWDALEIRRAWLRAGQGP